MKRLKKIFLRTFTAFGVIYLIVCSLMYFFQEKFIFHPKKLSADYKFSYDQKFEEVFVGTSDGSRLSGLLFKSDSSKGLVIYLHGNSGALDSWGDIAPRYTKLGYDIFLLDYRGFGKSEGSLESEEQMYSDVQCAYNLMKKKYNEKNIVIIGYSIGTGPATWLASQNRPSRLILLAPYYSITDMMHRRYPFLPGFLLKYKFNTFKNIQNVKAPLIIFHGTADKVIPYDASVMLSGLFGRSGKLITLSGLGHNGIDDNEIYLAELGKILKSSAN